MADERPQYQHGVGTIGGTQFHWGSGSPGQYWSIPYGDYPVTPDAPTGAWAHQVGAIPISNNVIPDSQLGRNRIGIMIHSGSASSLDQLYTQGCFKVAPQEWPDVRAEILKEASNGPLYLHVQPGGVAAFTNTKTFSQAGSDTPADNANAVANTTAVSRQPANLLNRGTGSRAPIAAQPSGDMTHEQFIRDYAQKIGINPDVAVGIANAEGLRAWSASNPNAGSYVDRTAGVPWSFGDFQLNTRNGMGVDAVKAGIDPKDPAQWQKADMFALDQMKQSGLGPWKGDAFAKSWGDKPITAPGTTLTSTAPGVVDPSIVAHGGTSPPLPADTAVAAAPDQQNWGQKLFAKPPPTKDAQGNTVEGKSPIEKLAGSFAKPAAAAPAAPEQQQIMPAQDPDPGLAPASSQLFTAVQAAAAKPLSWNSRPFGYGVGQMPIDPAMMAGQGTTLNSMGGYYG